MSIPARYYEARKESPSFVRSLLSDSETLRFEDLFTEPEFVDWRKSLPGSYNHPTKSFVAGPGAFGFHLYAQPTGPAAEALRQVRLDHSSGVSFEVIEWKETGQALVICNESHYINRIWVGFIDADSIPERRS